MKNLTQTFAQVSAYTIRGITPAFRCPERHLDAMKLSTLRYLRRIMRR